MEAPATLRSVLLQPELHTLGLAVERWRVCGLHLGGRSGKPPRMTMLERLSQAAGGHHRTTMRLSTAQVEGGEGGQRAEQGAERLDGEAEDNRPRGCARAHQPPPRRRRLRRQRRLRTPLPPTTHKTNVQLYVSSAGSLSFPYN